MNPLMMMALQQMMNQQGLLPQGGQIPSSAPDGQGRTLPLEGMSSAITSPLPTSPLGEGTLEAIQAAKRSIGMNEVDHKRAMGMGLVKLFAGLAKPGYGDGLSGALSAAAQNIAPAVDAYRDEEERVQNRNAALLGHVSSLQADQQKAWQHALEKMMTQQHQEQVLAETRRHHQAQEKKSDALIGLQRMRLNHDTPQSVVIGGKEYSPIASKQEHRLFVNDKKNFGHLLKEITSIKKDYDAFRKSAQENLIDPQAPYYAGTIANEIKDLWGYISNNPDLKKETAARKSLEARMGKFTVELERKLKGGVLSEGMMKRFEKKGILPSLEDRPEVAEQKMNDLIKEISIYEKAASDSLKTGFVITPLDIEEEHSQEATDPKAAAEDEWVTMVNPETLEEQDVHKEDVAEAKKRQWRRK